MSADLSRPIGTATYQTQRLAERLKAAVVAEDYSIIRYEELSALIGMDVQADARGYLDSARGIVERETSRLLGCVPSQGIKLLDQQEQVAIGPDRVKRLRRLSTRTVKRLSLVEFGKLTEQEKTAVNAAASVAGAIAMFSQAKAVARIGQAVQAHDHQRLKVEDTIKLFHRET